MRIAVLGGGFAGTLHIRALQELARTGESIELFVAEPNSLCHIEERSTIVGRYLTAEALIASGQELDGIIVALPTALHLPAMECIARNIPPTVPVLLEKPAATNLAEVQEMFKLPFRRVMMGLTGRWHPEFVAAHEALDHIGWGSAGSQFRERIALSLNAEHHLETKQNVVVTVGIHTLDRLNWFSKANEDNDGVEFTHIAADNRFWKKPAVDFAEAAGQTHSFSFQVCWEWPRLDNAFYQLSLMTRQGRIIVKGFESATLYRENEKPCVLFQHDTTTSIEDRHLPGFTEQMKCFLNLVRNENTPTPYPTLNDGLTAQKLAEEIMQCAR